MRTKSLKKSGFTLLELLIVTAVIGTMGSIVLLTFPAAIERARDSQRISDLKQYQTALEQSANAKNGLYPRRAGSGNGMILPGSVCADMGLTDCEADPRDGKNECGSGSDPCRYRYKSNIGCGSPGDSCALRYVLWARLERPKNVNTYFVVCSNGQTGNIIETSIPPNVSATCPL